MRGSFHIKVFLKRFSYFFYLQVTNIFSYSTGLTVSYSVHLYNYIFDRNYFVSFIGSVIRIIQLTSCFILLPFFDYTFYA